MKSYRLLKKRGNYVEYEGKNPITYKGGDAVPSKYNLAKMFPDKFVLIRSGENGNVEIEQPDIPVPSRKKTTKKTEPKKASTQRKRVVPKAKPEGA